MHEAVAHTAAFRWRSRWTLGGGSVRTCPFPSVHLFAAPQRTRPSVTHGVLSAVMPSATHTHTHTHTHTCAGTKR